MTPSTTTRSPLATGVPGVTIQARPNGTFRVCWRHDGKQPRVTVDSVRDAKMLAKWLGRHGKDRPANDPDLLFAIGRTTSPVETTDPVTVGEALDALLAAATPRSVNTRRTQVRSLAPLFPISVQTLTLADVEAVFTDLTTTGGRSGNGQADNTWRGTGILLKKALRPYGKAELVEGYLTKSRSKRVRQPVLMTKAEMDELVWLGHDHGIGDLLAILADLGLRFGEAAALRGTHVERMAGHPMVLVREQCPANPTPTLANPDPAPCRLKSSSSVRDIPPSQRIQDMAAKARTDRLTSDPGLGGPWRHSYANRRLSKVSRDAIREGIVSRPVKFHDFRHSWGAHLLLGGTDIVTVSYLMGHSSPTITGEIYGHLTDRGIGGVRDLLK